MTRLCSTSTPLVAALLVLIGTGLWSVDSYADILVPDVPSANPPLPMPMESGTKLACAIHADCYVSPGSTGSACVREICYNPMNRYLAIEPNNDEPVALRVEMTASFFHSGSYCDDPNANPCKIDDDCRDDTTCIHNPPGAIGMQRWIDEPECYNARGSLLGDDTYPCDAGDGEFWLSDLVDTMPPMRVWDNTMPLYIGDCFISPVATYAMVATDDGGASFSDPTYMPTIFRPYPHYWADVIESKDVGGWWTGPNKVTGFIDIMAAVKFFEGADAVLPKLPVLDIDPQRPNHVAGFSDILHIVMAFQGAPYPYGTVDDPCG